MTAKLKQTSHSFRFTPEEDLLLAEAKAELSAMCAGCDIATKATVIKALGLLVRMTPEERIEIAERGRHK